MTDKKRKNIIILCVFIAFVLVSFFAVAPVMADPATFSKTIESLDAKKTTVAELTAASTAASAAITLLPNDIGTPIAEKLVDLSGYFVLIFSAIYLEKFLTTIAGYITFRYIIPLALLGLGINRFFGNEMVKRFAIRLLTFGLIIVLLIPARQSASRSSIQQTIEEANNASDEINENNDSEDTNALEEFFNRVKGGVSGQLKKFENILSNFIDAVAVLIVTTCVIPVVVLLLFLMIIRQFFGAMGSSSDDVKKLKDAKNAIVKK